MVDSVLRPEVVEKVCILRTVNRINTMHAPRLLSIISCIMACHWQLLPLVTFTQPSTHFSSCCDFTAHGGRIKTSVAHTCCQGDTYKVPL